MVLEKKDSFLLKGWSITIIVLHNFLHNTKQLPSQNEFNFSIEKVQSLVDIFLYNPSDIIRALLSFYGHYGVKIFIFLSAYGLTKIYLEREINLRIYLQRHITKIYKAFFLVLLFWIFYEMTVNKMSFALLWTTHAKAVLLKLIGLNIPGFALAPVGPWWFIPVIFQFYLLFPLLLYFFKKYGSYFLLALSTLTYVVLGMVDKKILFLNAIGHLPEYCLGIYLASQAPFQIKWPVFGLALMGFVLSHFHPIFWLFSGTSIILLILALYGEETRKSHKIMVNIGKVSLYIFLIHGFMRRPFLDWANSLDNDLFLLGCSLIFLLMVVATAVLFSKIKKPFRI